MKPVIAVFAAIALGIAAFALPALMPSVLQVDEPQAGNASDTFSDRMAIVEAETTVWDAAAFRVLFLTEVVVERHDCAAPQTSVGPYVVRQERELVALTLFALPISRVIVTCEGVAVNR